MKESLTIKNSRGLKLASVIHYSEHEKSQPCVLVLHGFLGNKEEKHLQSFCEGLTEVNIAAIRFDCSGFGESEGKTENEFRVSNYLTDIQDVFTYAKNLSFIDPSKIGVCGHSLGGSLAIIFSAIQQEVQACCAVQAGTKLTRKDSPLDLENWKATGWFKELCLEPVKRFVRLPYSMAEDADRFDALNYIGKIKIPIMILYGTNDDAVLPNNTFLLYEAAKNCEKELVKLDGFGHYFKNNPEQVKIVVEYVQQFFQKHLINNVSKVPAQL